MISVYEVILIHIDTSKVYVLNSLPSGHPDFVKVLTFTMLKEQGRELKYDIDIERIIYRQVPVSADIKLN